MRKLSSLFLVSLFVVAACDDAFQVWQPIKATDGMPSDAGGGCVQTDMLTPVAKCAAAKGLAGDNLICVDFASIPDQTLSDPPPVQLAGWFFNKDTMGRDCWEIANGKLQIKAFSMFNSSCSFLMPMLKSSDYQKYNKFTLSIIHRVHLDSAQKAQIMLGADDEQMRLMDWMTGKQPRKQWFQTVGKADLPNGSSNAFQPLFKLFSNVMVGSTAQGWQIESIAINGSL